MKSVFALFSLALIATLTVGCSSGSSSGNGGGGSGPTTGGTGGGQQKAPGDGAFTAHAWCNTYQMQGTELQDVFSFEEAGKATYEKYDFTNGQRGQRLAESEGTWGMSGTDIRMAIGTFKFAMQYSERDISTGAERVYVQMDNQWLPFDPCL